MDCYSFVVLYIPLHHKQGLCVRTVSRSLFCLVIGLYSDHATAKPYEIAHFTRMSLSRLQSVSVPDVQSLGSLAEKNPSGGSFFSNSHMQSCGQKAKMPLIISTMLANCRANNPFASA